MSRPLPFEKYYNIFRLTHATKRSKPTLDLLHARMEDEPCKPNGGFVCTFKASAFSWSAILYTANVLYGRLATLCSSQ